jgi:hypothetical protein
VIAGVVVHLAATCLFRRKDDLVAQPFKQRDDGPSRLREERVVETGDKQGYVHACVSIDFDR